MKKILTAIFSVFLVVVLVSCNQITYTVNFDTNGGMPEVIEAVKVGENKLVDEPEGVSKTGFYLEFWTNSEDNEEWDFETDKVKEDMTLVANWKEGEAPNVETFTVSFDTDGGTDIAAVTVERNKLLAAPSKPTKEGFKFIGWMLDGNDFSFSTPITKDIALTAIWEEKEEQLPIGLPEIEGTTPIGEFFKANEGSSAKIVGVVTSLAPHNSFSMEDDSGAIALRLPNMTSATIDFEVGDVVEANVKKLTYNGLIQGEVQGTYTVHTGDFGRLLPIDLNEYGLDTNKLAKIQSRTVSITAAEVTSVTTPNNAVELIISLGSESITVRLDTRVAGNDASILTAFEAGDLVDIKGGTLAWFNNPQIMLDSNSEIAINEHGIFGEGATAEDKLNQSLEMLTMDSIIGFNISNLEIGRDLGLIYSFEDVVITWESSNSAFIDESGKVTRPEEDAGDVNVTLTATIKIADLTATKEFEFIVLEYVESSNPSDQDPNIVSYYSELGGLSGDAFRNALIIMIKTEGVAQGSTSQVKAADTYQGENYNIYTGFGSYGNREHVWPNSKLGSAPSYDLHNLRAAVTSVNSSRSNYPFVDNNRPFTGTESYQKIGSGWYPGDEHIGDVARIAFYISTRYSLSLDIIGSERMFLEWHQLDPVSDFERVRNNNIQELVGSRNPFIDYPEYVDVVLGSTQISYEMSDESLVDYIKEDSINLLIFEQQYVFSKKEDIFSM